MFPIFSKGQPSKFAQPPAKKAAVASASGKPVPAAAPAGDDWRSRGVVEGDEIIIEGTSSNDDDFQRTAPPAQQRQVATAAAQGPSAPSGSNPAAKKLVPKRGKG